ncbi:MAG: TadE/TadG family type IV pilus assembly protein [Actinomycetes bacterium]
MRRCARPARDDSGNAIVEFVFLAVLLMLPLVYVLLTVFRVQAATYAVASATREAGRVYVSSPDSDVAPGRALTAASIVMADSGLRLSSRDLRVTCSADPCLTPGATLDVAIGYDVALPFLPRLFDSAPATVHVTGRHLEVVDRFRPVR